MVPVYYLYLFYVWQQKYNVNSFIGIVVLITVCDI